MIKTLAVASFAAGLAVISAPASAVPEPVNWALMLAGFGMVGLARHRRTTFVTA